MRVRIALVAGAALWAVALTAMTSGGQPPQPADAAAPRRLVNPLDLTDVDLEAGGDIFSARCAGCHGADGAGAAARMANAARAGSSSSPLDLTRTAMRNAQRRRDLHRHRRRRHQPRHAGLRRPGGDGALAARVLRAEPGRRPPSRPRHRRRRMLPWDLPPGFPHPGAGRQPDDPRRRSSSGATSSTTRGCRATGPSRCAHLPRAGAGLHRRPRARGRLDRRGAPAQLDEPRQRRPTPQSLTWANPRC